MSPTEAFVARANIVRMRLQIAAEQDPATMADFERLLDDQIEKLRAGGASGEYSSFGDFKETPKE